MLDKNKIRNKDIFCSVFVQQNKVRSVEESQALSQIEALLKTSKYKLSASIGSYEVW